MKIISIGDQIITLGHFGLKNLPFQFKCDILEPPPQHVTMQMENLNTVKQSHINNLNETSFQDS